MIKLPYSRQQITNDDINEVSIALKSDLITQGGRINEFEEKIAKFVNAKYAVVFNSATSALHAAYFSLGLKENDQIITSPITFVATSNAALYLGAKPIFSDIEKETGNLDISIVGKKINNKTKIVVPVHYGGLSPDLKNLSKIAKKNNLFVVEDASQALGTLYHGSKIGSNKYSDISVFSFQALKHITTGEGGAATTNNKKVYEKMLLFRTHGITKNRGKFINKNSGDWYHEMQELGFNYRMTDFQAALGLSQLKKINKFLARRLEIAKIYNREFENNEYFDVHPYDKENHSTYHLYPILLKKDYVKFRRKIFDELRKKGLGVQVHYIPVNSQPYYKSLGYKKTDTPKAWSFYEREISIPLFPFMNDKDIRYVINILKKTFKQI